MRRVTAPLLAALLLPPSGPALAADRATWPGEAALPLFRVDDDDDRDDDAGRALAIVGALMGLALLEQAAREERRSEPEAARPAPLPEEAIARPVLPEVPVRPAWIESLAEAPRPVPAPIPRAMSGIPEIGDAAEEEPAAAPTPDDVPAVRVPPPPAAETAAPPTSSDVADVFGRAAEEGRTGF